MRHPDDAACAEGVDALLKAARAIARRRQLKVEWEQTMQHPATPCSPELSEALARSVEAVQTRNLSLVSGAGHDAVVMAALTPVAMLFVRCRDGLSHHPDEFAAPADLEVALRVMVDFLEKLAQAEAQRPPARARGRSAG